VHNLTSWLVRSKRSVQLATNSQTSYRHTAVSALCRNSTRSLARRHTEGTFIQFSFRTYYRERETYRFTKLTATNSFYYDIVRCFLNPGLRRVTGNKRENVTTISNAINDYEYNVVRQSASEQYSLVGETNGITLRALGA
jgi:hypothetical protein